MLVSLERRDIFSLEGKTAVLTGASGFLGRTLAETLLTNGARVLVIGRSDKLTQRADEWREKYGDDRVRSFQADMYDLEGFGRILDQIVAEEKNLEVLVNNAHELRPANRIQYTRGGAGTGFV